MWRPRPSVGDQSSAIKSLLDYHEINIPEIFATNCRTNVSFLKIASASRTSRKDVNEFLTVRHLFLDELWWNEA